MAVSLSNAMVDVVYFPTTPNEQDRRKRMPTIVPGIIKGLSDGVVDEDGCYYYYDTAGHVIGKTWIIAQSIRATAYSEETVKLHYVHFKGDLMVGTSDGRREVYSWRVEHFDHRKNKTGSSRYSPELEKWLHFDARGRTVYP